jgi:membrane protein YdbS with pleckstrin-like domain
MDIYFWSFIAYLVIAIIVGNLGYYIEGENNEMIMVMGFMWPIIPFILPFIFLFFIIPQYLIKQIHKWIIK